VAVVGTVLAAICYAMAQQVTRSSADDAPAALAQRTANTLSRGGSPAALTPEAVVDLASDLGPFLTVYGPDGAVEASTARLDGGWPVVPRAALAQARLRGSDRVTWQPRAGVQEAVVALSWHSATQEGVVVAGACLRPAEGREDQLMVILVAGWLAAMIGSAAVAGLGAAWLGSARSGR
jgi:hypothetical protein